MNLFSLFATLALDTRDYDSGIERASKSGESLAGKLKNGLATAGKAVSAGLGLVTGAASAAGGALLALEASTEEYRIAQGKLNTAFEAAGYGADVASQAYSGFYNILGDVDTATEASQLLAKLALNAEDMSEWTKISAGVWGTFGDALPIEGLIESANETARVGQVTGSLADALNWASINEDEFNAALAACGSESERNQLIMNTLSATYNDASEAFYRNNEALIQSRSAQTQMMDSLSQLGATVSQVKSALLAEFAPAISQVVLAFNDVINGVAGADQAIGQAVQGLIGAVVDKLPGFLEMGVQILETLVRGIINSIPSLVNAVPGVIEQLVQALVNLLPTLIDVGQYIMEEIGTGINQGLPNLMDRLPQIIDSIVGFIGDKLPVVLDRGVDILLSITDGIIKSIPKLVAALPKVITSISNFIVESVPKIIDAAIKVALGIATGIIKAIPEIVKAVPKVLEALVNGFTNGIKMFVDIGKNIVEGLWKGITGMGDWIKNKISGFFGGIVDGAKNILGIRSPSRVFASIGEYSAEGFGVGWDDKFEDVEREINQSMDFTATVNRGNEKSKSVGSDSDGERVIVLKINDFELARVMAPAISKRLAFNS